MITASTPSSPHPVALVTGAGTRIGAAIAQALARAGHAVIIHYRADAQGAAAVRDTITAAGGKAAMVQADLTGAPASLPRHPPLSVR